MKNYLCLSLALSLIFIECNSPNKFDIDDRTDVTEADPIVKLFRRALKDEFGKSEFENYKMFFSKLKSSVTLLEFYKNMEFLCSICDEITEIIPNLPDSINFWKKKQCLVR